MFKECECGKQFLTEADTYVVIPTQNYKLNCGCYYEIEALDYDTEFKAKIPEMIRTLRKRTGGDNPSALPVRKSFRVFLADFKARFNKN